MTEPRVAVLVPRRADGGPRDQLWAFAKAWWLGHHPDWPIHEGEHYVGLFNRSAAINSAAEQAGDWDIGIILDSDVILDPIAVRAAVDLAQHGVMSVAGHQRVSLTKEGTAKILDGYRGPWTSDAFIEKTYHDHWSSCVVVSRGLWDEVGGFDPLFRGWGYEDDAFRWSCETMAERPMLRVSGTIWHLWHPSSTDPVPGKRTNKGRAAMYLAALNDKPAMRELLAEAHAVSAPVELKPTRIPRILHRTVPEQVNAQAEEWWGAFAELHPGWDLRTHRDPLDPKAWPVLGDLWESCENGAQKAGLIRLEALWRDGGVYVDSDVEPYRSLEPLLHLPGFAAWEDANVVPDAVIGCEPGHPAVAKMIKMARVAVEHGKNAWDSGPGVTTAILPNRDDWILFPPGAFFPYHYRQKQLRSEDHRTQQPWCFMAHHWDGSWLTDEQKRANSVMSPKQRPRVMRR